MAGGCKNISGGQLLRVLITVMPWKSDTGQRETSKKKKEKEIDVYRIRGAGEPARHSRSSLIQTQSQRYKGLLICSTARKYN